MTATASTVTPSQPSAGGVPRLNNGDRLTRAEFERRYSAMPNVNKAELIEGVVYMPSPVRFQGHAEQHAHLITWLGYYISRTPGVRLGDNATIRLDGDNVPQPDVSLLLPAQAGGGARIDEDKYVSGPPELIAEIAASTVSIDLHQKLHAYQRNGVKEYLVWRTEDRAIDWFALHEGRYVPIPADERGLVRSGVFPGLWLDPAALLGGDLAGVLAAVDLGVATPEHRAFAGRLMKP